MRVVCSVGLKLAECKARMEWSSKNACSRSGHIGDTEASACKLANNHSNQDVEQKSPWHCCQCATTDCMLALLPVDDAYEVLFVCFAVE